MIIFVGCPRAGLVVNHAGSDFYVPPGRLFDALLPRFSLALPLVSTDILTRSLLTARKDPSGGLFLDGSPTEVAGRVGATAREKKKPDDDEMQSAR